MSSTSGLEEPKLDLVIANRAAYRCGQVSCLGRGCFTALAEGTLW
jgi:hypothetical protein